MAIDARLEGILMARLVLTPAGTTVPVEVELQPDRASGENAFRFRAGRDECAIEIIGSGEGEGRLALDGRVVPFYYATVDEQIEVWVDGRTYRFEFAAATRSRRSASRPAHIAASGEITAPMPGTIQKILVGPGDRVAAGDALVVMISMKMEMTLSAPFASTVTAVECRAGRLVEMGALLVTLKEPADGG